MALETMQRKQFLVVLLGGVATLAVGGCGGGGGDGAAGAQGGGCSAGISGNHGHVLTLPAADLDATVDKTYDIQGAADHTHSVTFTAAQLAQLKAGKSVSVTTTVAFAHQHTISELCA